MKILALPILLAIAAALGPQERDRSKIWDALRARFDTDLDGKVSEAEFTRGKAAFRRLDRNHDGFLTAEDFVDRPSTQPGPKESAPERAPTEEELKFFETRIRPVLSNSCFECHSATSKKLKGGLRLDSREGMTAGGASGPAIVPGDAENSLLVQAVRYTNNDLQMPPKKPLADDVVKDFERWISMGAPWTPTSATPASTAPANGGNAASAPKHPIDWEKARQFWAFRSPQRVAPPATKDKQWAWSDIDRFLLASMEEKGVAPVADADKRTWLRRATFDLTGLPPTPEELDSFDKDRTNEAFAKVVDRLLASPAFGERFGRHWLDVARYAESSGKDSNVLYPQAWRYRDWVIAAFDADEPYDQFLREQIAGDLMPAANDDERAQHAIATGYLAVGAKSHNNRDRRQFALDVADEQIDAVSEGMLGLTVACARCHDHKFDPIPTQDYYALAGIFLSSDTRYGTMRVQGNNQPGELIELPKDAHVPNGPAMEPKLRALLERGRDRVAGLVEDGMKQRGSTPMTGGAKDGDGKKKPDTDLVRLRAEREQKELLDNLLARFDASGNALPSNRLAMGVVEAKPHDIAVLDRGELDKPGAVARRGVPQVLCASGPVTIGKGSGRKELADFIASKDNPLTARVWANRVWLHLFGRGIVSTPDNFGASGQKPDHPELLDWLATELVSNGWSTKSLVREIVLSHAYRLASANDARHAKVDPEAITLWRMPERRLEAEAIRDAMLSAAGTLQKSPPVGSPVGTLEGTTQREEYLQEALKDRPVRSVYLALVRDHIPESLEVFDAPDPAFVTGDREETNVATQALYLMNDKSVLEAADAFASRLLARAGNDDERIAYGFELAVGRKPAGSELAAVRDFLRDFEKRIAKDEPRDGGDGRAPGREGREGRDRRGRRDAPAAEAPHPSGDPKRSAWAAFALSLFQSAEFRYLG